MKVRHILVSVFFGITLTVSMLFILHESGVRAAPNATIRYVQGTIGTDIGNNCSNSQIPCKTIHHALIQAQEGDTIRVANTTAPEKYKERITIQKSVILQGGWNATVSGSAILWNRPTPCEASRTIIDAEKKGRVITISDFKNPTIDCFVIAHGNTALLGGGIYGNYTSPTIINNIIINNSGTTTDALHFAAGGGIYLTYGQGTTVISGNLITDNSGNAAGGGRGGGIDLYATDAQILSNTIKNNLAGKDGYGGGITVRGGKTTIAYNSITHNTGSRQRTGAGGGIYAIGIEANSALTIVNNLIDNNIAINGPISAGLSGRGGGIYIKNYSHGIIQGNTFNKNTAAKNGAGTFLPSGNGGGLYLENAQAIPIENNTFEGNIGGYNFDGNGGGAYIYQSGILFSGNRLTGNSATWTGSQGIGGGIIIHDSTVQVISNVIESNFAAGYAGSTTIYQGIGGGIVISNSTATLRSNQILSNTTTNSISGTLGSGGGIDSISSTLIIQENTIANNNANAWKVSVGGGLYLYNSVFTLEGNRITGNTAFGNQWGRGGGIRLAICPAFTITNNIIAKNSSGELGSGIGSFNSTGKIIHNTIAENTQGDGTGIYLDHGPGSITLANNIIVSQTVGISVTAGSTVTINATLWGAGTWANTHDWFGSGTIITGTINLWGNPSFVNPANLDYHIALNSAALDSGVNAGLRRDIDGDYRPMGFGYDIGADEVHQKIYLFLPLTSKNHP